MTTYVSLFNADGFEIGKLSPVQYQALVDLLNGSETPQAPTTPICHACIECSKHPRAIGIFCACCFARLREHEAGWAAAWYGRDWDEACKQAESH